MKRATLALTLGATIALVSSGGPVRADVVDAGARGDDGGSGDQEARHLVEERADAGYAGRAAITRALVAMDDRAVAALVVARRSKAAGTRAWAAETLEAMGRERADEQIRTRDEDVLVAILRAYGEARDPDALGVLSSFVGSDRPAAREAARAALLDYGGEAISTLRQDYTELTGQLPSAAWDAAQTAHALFAASDRARLRDVYALLDEGLADIDAGALGPAVVAFDAVLARHADLGQRPEVTSAYVAYALSIEDRDPVGARLYLEKAARLRPTPPEASQIAGELATLEARELEARGVPDEDAYAHALSLDPENSRARAALDRLHAAADARSARHRHIFLASAGALILVVALVLLAGRGSRGSPRRGSKKQRDQTGT